MTDTDNHHAQAYTLNQADYEKLSNVLRRRHQEMREEYNAKFLAPVLRAADELDRLTAEVERLLEFHQKVVGLDPSKDSDEGFNEWGEADCFKKAQALSREALEQMMEARRLK